MKRLNKKHIEAARLLHNGESEASTAKSVGVSKPTIQAWKKATLFKAELERLSKGERTRQESELSAALDKRLQLSERLWRFCHERIEEIDESAQAIPPESRWRQLPGLTKSLAEIVRLTLETENQALGIDTIVSELDVIAQQTP